jgi:hypothetical protein
VVGVLRNGIRGPREKGSRRSFGFVEDARMVLVDPSPHLPDDRAGIEEGQGSWGTDDVESAL